MQIRNSKANEKKLKADSKLKVDLCSPFLTEIVVNSSERFLTLFLLHNRRESKKIIFRFYIKLFYDRNAQFN